MHVLEPLFFLLCLGLLLLPNAGQAGKGTPAPLSSVVCDAEVQSFGSYYDPKIALNYANPIVKIGLAAKAILMAARGLNSATNWAEGRGIITARWSVTLTLASGTLPKGPPPTRFFTTADDMGQGGANARKFVETFAKQAGCTKVNLHQTNVPPMA